MQSRPMVFPSSQNCRQGSVLLEKEKALGTLHENTLLQQDPCSPFLTDYPQGEVKMQGRSTMH